MSNDLNQCQFIGRLGSVPEVRYMPNGKAVTSFSIAVGSQWKDKAGDKQESTEWVNVTAFDKLGEICGEWLKKGSQVFISGKMKTDKYEKDGVTKYSTKIIAQDMQMLGGKREGSETSSDQAEHHSGAREQNNPSYSDGKTVDKPAAKSGSFDDAFDDSIPF